MLLFSSTQMMFMLLTKNHLQSWQPPLLTRRSRLSRIPWKPPHSGHPGEVAVAPEEPLPEAVEEAEVDPNLHRQPQLKKVKKIRIFHQICAPSTKNSRKRRTIAGTHSSAHTPNSSNLVLKKIEVLTSSELTAQN